MPELLPEDYKEPVCPACTDFYEPDGEAHVIPIPIARVLDRLDRYFDRNDVAGAQRHLEGWLEQARAGHDRRGELAVLSELVGLLRKRGLKEPAMAGVQRIDELLDSLSLRDSVTGGTMLLNAGTVCQTFGNSADALTRYEAAQTVFEQYLEPGDLRLGGLYNNMALPCVSLGQHDRAVGLYEKALSIMTADPGSRPEAAITCLNLANALEARDGFEAAEAAVIGLLDRAEELLFDPDNRRCGNLAFVYEKCAPTFDYYGRFITATDLRRLSEDIYAGH